MVVCSICTNSGRKCLLIVKSKNPFLGHIKQRRWCSCWKRIKSSSSVEQKYPVPFSRGFIWRIHRTYMFLKFPCKNEQKPVEGCGKCKVKLCLWTGAVFNFDLSPPKVAFLLLGRCSLVMDPSASVNAEAFQRSDPIGGSLHRGFSNRTVARWLTKCVYLSVYFADRCTKYRNWAGFWWVCVHNNTSSVAKHQLTKRSVNKYVHRNMLRGTL